MVSEVLQRRDVCPIGGTKHEKRIWRCNHKYAGETPCTTPHVTDEQIQEAFLKAVAELLEHAGADKLLDQAVLAELDTTDLHIQADQLLAQVNAANDALNKLIAHNARVAQDQNDYQKRYDKLSAEHSSLIGEYQQLLDQISDLEKRQAAYQHYKNEIATLTPAALEFTPYLWHTLTDHAEVNVDGTITFTFRDGTTLGG